MTRRRRCKDCPDTSRRPASYPGPRCATHDRQVRRQRREAAWAQHIERTYGITADEYQLILDAQGGRCFICQRATGATRKLSVDHDHVTGLVRGLLCRPCNKMLGHARDDSKMFDRAAGYLDRPPAHRAGVERKVPEQQED